MGRDGYDDSQVIAAMQAQAEEVLRIAGEAERSQEAEVLTMASVGRAGLALAHMVRHWFRQQEWEAKTALMRPVSVPLSELLPTAMPHDPADCFMYRGKPHLEPCMNAEAYTRWYWLDGPGSRPFESTQIALATARLVAEAYQAKEERLRRLADDALPDADERARQRGLGPDA